MITKYGLNTFIFCALFSLVLFLGSLFIQNGWIKYPLLTVAVVFLLFSMNFFRDPERTPPNKDNVIVSPADGEIVTIKEIDEDQFLKSKAQQVSIFMSPINVHVNRIPISGKVDFLKYVKGDYLVAFHEKADKRNERTEIGITSKFGKMFFTQIAGFIARRIVCDLKVGDDVTMGNRFGMIKFGSRSDVIVPLNWKAKFKMGDKVKAGETILFEIEK
ncbi:MAG: phosphatidylserine decarboxylase family protein [Bacteroidetes bacterium]|nr:phosphatidylserine decarboxylase family protein [Bacteroidota bacterium]